MTLTWIVPGEEMDFFTTFWEGSVDGATFGIDPGPVPPEHLLEVEPGLHIALYIPSMFEDADGDAQHGEGEIYVGISRHWPVWVDNDPPAEWADKGLVAGWNAIELDLESDGEFTTGDPLAIPIDADLWPNDSIEISGTYTGDTPVDTQRLTLISGVAMEGGPIVDLLYDDVLTDPWAIAVSGDAPASHQLDQDDFGLTMAWEYPFSYLDNDGTGGPSDGDLPLNSACLGLDYVVLYWMEAATSVETAFYFEYAWGEYGWTPGWFAGGISPTSKEQVPYALEPEELSSLELSGACSPWDFPT